MDYKASLDTLAKIITSGIVILFLFIGYKDVKALSVSQGDTTAILIHSGKLLLFIGILLVCYILAPKAYRLDNTDLTIIRPASNIKIRLNDIAEIRTIADGELTTSIRTFGVGGLFGYYGKYYYPKIGNMTFYATKRTNRILIQTKEGQKIVITPDDLTLIEQLKENLKPRSA